MAARKPSSLVRNDESIMRDPSFSLSPPSSDGSTVSSSRGSRPSLAFQQLLQFVGLGRRERRVLR